MNNPAAGKTKTVQNYISATYPDGHTETLFTPLAPYETPEALDRLCEAYNRVIGNFELEPLLAVPIFIHDFLCIHPFNDGNGRMSRLLTTLLLYQNGFYVGKYVSLEAKIAKIRTCIMKPWPLHKTAGMKAKRTRYRLSNISSGLFWRRIRILKIALPWWKQNDLPWTRYDWLRRTKLAVLPSRISGSFVHHLVSVQ